MKYRKEVIRISEQQENAALYIGMFDQFADRLEELDCKRYNKEFLQVYKAKSEQEPIVLMFNAFVAGIDMGGKIIAKLYELDKEKAPTER